MVISIDRNDTVKEYCLQLLTDIINTDQFGHHKKIREKHTYFSCVFSKRDRNAIFEERSAETCIDFQIAIFHNIFNRIMRSEDALLCKEDTSYAVHWC